MLREILNFCSCVPSDENIKRLCYISFLIKSLPFDLADDKWPTHKSFKFYLLTTSHYFFFVIPNWTQIFNQSSYYHTFYIHYLYEISNWSIVRLYCLASFNFPIMIYASKPQFLKQHITHFNESESKKTRNIGAIFPSCLIHFRYR